MSAVIVKNVDKKFGKPAGMSFGKRILRAPVKGAQGISTRKEALAGPLLTEQKPPALSQNGKTVPTCRNLFMKMRSWNSPERSWLFKKRYLSHVS